MGGDVDTLFDMAQRVLCCACIKEAKQVATYPGLQQMHCLCPVRGPVSNTIVPGWLWRGTSFE